MSPDCDGMARARGAGLAAAPLPGTAPLPGAAAASAAGAASTTIACFTAGRPMQRVPCRGWQILTVRDAAGT